MSAPYIEEPMDFVSPTMLKTLWSALRASLKAIDPFALQRKLEENVQAINETVIGLERKLEQARLDAARYRWLRERMQVRHERPMSGGAPRKTLNMRVGFGFADCNSDPNKGWTSPHYFQENMNELDRTIDGAISLRKTHLSESAAKLHERKEVAP